MSEGAQPDRSNVEVFKLVAGEIFGRLYEAFPLPLELNKRELADRVRGRTREPPPVSLQARSLYTDPLAEEDARYEAVAENTVEWLKATGFMMPGVESRTRESYVLSPKGSRRCPVVSLRLPTRQPSPRVLAWQRQ
jgi:hypothetical protein